MILLLLNQFIPKSWICEKERTYRTRLTNNFYFSSSIPRNYSSSSCFSKNNLKRELIKNSLVIITIKYIQLNPCLFLLFTSSVANKRIIRGEERRKKGRKASPPRGFLSSEGKEAREHDGTAVPCPDVRFSATGPRRFHCEKTQILGSSLLPLSSSSLAPRRPTLPFYPLPSPY